MKKTNIFTILTLGIMMLGFSACQDGDWDPVTGYKLWNESIEPGDQIPISQLKGAYFDAISNSSYAKITEDWQIHGVVVVNDEGGNISQQLIVCDDVYNDDGGYIIIGINENSLYNYVKTGQQFRMNLKGLYIGGYGKNAQIGYPSMSSTSGAQRIGRMTIQDWRSHVNFLGDPVPSLVPEPIPFYKQMDRDTFSDHLVYVEGNFVDADGTAILAPDEMADAGNAVNRSFKTQQGETVDIRTSTYSDFARMVMPKGLVRVYGVAIRYNNDWQIQMRTAKDLVDLSQINPDDQDPTQGDGNQDPTQGDDQDPTQGDDNQNPTPGGDDQEPTQGGDDQDPTQGGSQDPIPGQI